VLHLFEISSLLAHFPAIFVVAISATNGDQLPPQMEDYRSIYGRIFVLEIDYTLIVNTQQPSSLSYVVSIFIFYVSSKMTTHHHFYPF
jgi:hypothetical protein